MLFLRPTDGITMNRYRLLADAKAKALALVEGYTPPEPVDAAACPGASAASALAMAVARLPPARHGHRRTTSSSPTTSPRC